MPRSSVECARNPGAGEMGWNGRGWMAALCTSALLSTPALAQEAEQSLTLEPAARVLELRQGQRRTTGEKAEQSLAPAVRAALNTWAPLATEHGLAVAICAEAEALVLGHCDAATLVQTAAWLDDTWELLGPVRDAADEGWHDAVVVLLFDREGLQSPAWGAVLDGFVRASNLPPDGAAQLKRDPGPLTLREVPAFLQPTFDLAGNAAAGDDEFRLGNEVAHKFVQCLVTERFGQVPESLRFGLGYVAEQRLFRSIYQFQATGFVSADSHFDWPKKAADGLKQALKDDDFSLAELALQGAPGSADTPQMLTWAALDYLSQTDPDGLAKLLGQLGQLHHTAAPYGGAPLYAGARDGTEALLRQHLDAIDGKALAKHVKRVK